MEERPIDDITAKYHFLAPDDTLAILDEEGKLKGYMPSPSRKKNPRIL